MEMRESSEDYLEAILMLRERLGMVRAVHVAEELDFTKASVSIAMKKLRENGYVRLDENGFLLLTPTGEAIAAQVYQRHKVLTDFFISLGVDPAIAAKDACKVEHDLSQETFEKLLAHARQNVQGE
jgi:DtxR family Mn-dependent transcriptional regulator